MIHLLLMVSGQSIFIHWDRVSEGVLFPRIDGIDPYPGNLVSNLNLAKTSEGDLSTESVNHTVNSSFPSSISFMGSVNMSHPSVNELTVREIQPILAREKIKCRACSEKSDFIDAIRTHLTSLSIKSLKNFIVVRGLRCHDCKSKAELIHLALHGAHLPHLNVTVPLFILEGCWLYPRGSLRMVVMEPRYQFMLDWVMRRDGRFGLLPTARHGIIARIQEMRTEKAGRVAMTIVAEHRFRIHGSDAMWEIENSHGLMMANATLFVDDPLTTSKVAELKQFEKNARRDFFRHDSDAKAAKREMTLLGNPPAENLGPEVFSHWLAMASEVGTKKKEMFLTTSTQRRLKLGYESFLEDLNAKNKRTSTDSPQRVSKESSSREASQEKEAKKEASEAGESRSAKKKSDRDEANQMDSAEPQTPGNKDESRRASNKKGAPKAEDPSVHQQRDGEGGKKLDSERRKGGRERREASRMAQERSEAQRSHGRQRPPTNKAKF